MGRRPPDAVDTRLLAAEAVASAALALIQHPAVWEALTSLALVMETAQARRLEGLHAVGEAVVEVLQDLDLADVDADHAARLLDVVDHAARAWAAIAHPGMVEPPLPGLRAVK